MAAERQSRNGEKQKRNIWAKKTEHEQPSEDSRQCPDSRLCSAKAEVSHAGSTEGVRSPAALAGSQDRSARRPLGSAYHPPSPFSDFPIFPLLFIFFLFHYHSLFPSSPVSIPPLFLSFVFQPFFPAFSLPPGSRRVQLSFDHFIK